MKSVTTKLIGLTAALGILVTLAATPAFGKGLDPAIEAALRDRAAQQLDMRDHAMRLEVARSGVSSQQALDHNMRLDPAISAAVNNRNNEVLTSRDWADNYGGIQDLTAPATSVPSDDGFGWNDAGIGAGTILALMLLAALGTFFVRYGRHQLKRA